MNANILTFYCLAIVFCGGLSIGCLEENASSSSRVPPVGQNKLEGVLLRHPDAHTKQSMLTGNYHLRTSDGKLHLISSSEKVSEEDFDSHHECSVRLFGQIVAGEIWDSSDETEGPSLEKGETWKRPDSFRVEKLVSLE